MRKDTILCTALVATFILGFGLLMFSLPWLNTLGSPQTLTGSRPSLALPREAPARASGQTIALTCARMANVDMAGQITLAQAQEMERCADRMMAIMR